MRRSATRYGLVPALMAGALCAGIAGCAGNDSYSPRDCAVTGPDTLVSLQFDQREVTVAVGRSVALVAWVRGPAGAYIECPPPYTFQIGDPSIAYLEERIVVRGRAPGTTYLTGRGGGRSDSIPVTVTPAAAANPH